MAVLERIFRQRISRSQQDAHEFLQVVAETLAEEYHKQKKHENGINLANAEPESVSQNVNEKEADEDEDEEEEDGVVINVENLDEIPDEKKERSEDEGMPLEGKLESEIECQQCHFKPKLTVSTFVVLTLPVPQKVRLHLDC